MNFNIKKNNFLYERDWRSCIMKYGNIINNYRSIPDNYIFYENEMNHYYKKLKKYTNYLILNYIIRNDNKTDIYNDTYKKIGILNDIKFEYFSFKISNINFNEFEIFLEKFYKLNFFEYKNYTAYNKGSFEICFKTKKIISTRLIKKFLKNILPHYSLVENINIDKEVLLL